MLRQAATTVKPLANKGKSGPGFRILSHPPGRPENRVRSFDRGCRLCYPTGWVLMEEGHQVRDLDELFQALAISRFRSRFRLSSRDRAYLAEKTVPIVLDHGRQFILDRLAPARPKNDGRQTPMRGHPIFLAQHATATCCRACLSKWHGIPTGREITLEEVDYILAVFRRWLIGQGGCIHPVHKQGNLF